MASFTSEVGTIWRAVGTNGATGVCRRCHGSVTIYYVVPGITFRHCGVRESLPPELLFELQKRRLTPQKDTLQRMFIIGG